jgi:hypothetical protein
LETRAESLLSLLIAKSFSFLLLYHKKPVCSVLLLFCTFHFRIG